jgi:hypothetical protein
MDEEENRWNGEENGSIFGFMRVWKAMWFGGWIDGWKNDWTDGGMNTFYEAVPWFKLVLDSL